MSLALLTSTIARHFETATVDGAHVDLGLGGLALDCRVGAVQELFGGVQSAQLLMTLSGGAWHTPVELATNGYGADLDEAIATGACTWTCTFAAVLASALTGEPAARTQHVELSLGGVPTECYVATFDTVLQLEPGGEQTDQSRGRLGAFPSIAPALLGALEAADVPRREMMIASVYLGELGERRIVELRLDGKPYQFSDAMFEHVQPPPAQQIVSLRELAILVPATD